jgi:hypothetical protein
MAKHPPRQVTRLLLLAGVLLALLIPPAAALACDTGGDNSPSPAKTKKR